MNRCCVPKKPLPTPSGLLSLWRECFAKAHFWKHKLAAQRLWGCADQELGLGNIWFRVIISSVQELWRNILPWNIIPVSQGMPKTLEGPTFKTLCQHSNLLCCKSNKKCVQSVFPPKNQRKKRKVQGPKLSLPFSAPTGGQFLWGNTSFSPLSSFTAKPNAKFFFKI